MGNRGADSDWPYQGAIDVAASFGADMEAMVSLLDLLTELESDWPYVPCVGCRLNSAVHCKCKTVPVYHVPCVGCRLNSAVHCNCKTVPTGIPCTMC
jgi:hypothetical protein